MGRLLVGFDGSEPARRALAHALRRAKALGDEVVLLTAIPAGVAKSSLAAMMPLGLALPAAFDKTFEANAQGRLDDVVREHANAGVRLRGEVRTGDAAQVLLDACRDLGADEIVIGHKSYEAGELKLGPIAERLVRLAPATVTVVR